MTEPEVLYAVRRKDRDEIGDYSFVCVEGPNDWSPVEYEEVWEPTEYELVKMTVEVVTTRTMPTCQMCSAPAVYWGLCTPHAAEDDPEAFAENEAKANA